ncbi:zinc finger protein 503-like [Xyrauchen texanus]|uniref:zinc finger protein 503-like n=1 Tax=Xyrauchen texanus TaxID=154827 RepID=UPI0022422E63|nr:zinc finger protein 503-like [Xyrauchen texanus]
MITLPSESALFRVVNLVWEKNRTQNPLLHSLPPADPTRQANRLPVKVLKMLARNGHILHPDYLQHLPSTPVSPIELDAKKSPLALLAQTCSQIGKSDAPCGTKLSALTSDKDTKSSPLKISDIGAEDKSSFKPYSKSSERKDSDGDKTGFRVPSATCRPVTPRTGSPSSCGSGSPQPGRPESGDKVGKRDCDANKSSSLDNSGSTNPSRPRSESNSDTNKPQDASKPSTCDATTNASSALGSGLIAPVSPYRPGHTVFPISPAGLPYHGALAGAYASYHQPFLPHGVALDPSKASSSQLINAQLSGAAGSLTSKAGSSPLAGASPPSIMSTSLCRDPFCLSYHCASHLSPTSSHDTATTTALKSGYPVMFPTHPLHPLSASAPSFPGHPLYAYGFMLPNESQSHVCNWVSANGPCDKRFSSSEELLSHLRHHTAFTGAEKLISGYPNSLTAMACHMPGAPGAPLALRTPHHALGLGTRYHPYSKSPLPTPGAPMQLPAATGPFYSPYALYGQRLTTAPGLGYQ